MVGYRASTMKQRSKQHVKDKNIMKQSAQIEGAKLIEEEATQEGQVSTKDTHGLNMISIQNNAPNLVKWTPSLSRPRHYCCLHVRFYNTIPSYI